MALRITNNIKVYDCKDGRNRVYLKDTKQVVSYPKYLIEQVLRRRLNDNEQVHHIDENPLNNDIDNLEVRLLGEHQKQHATKYYDKEVICQWCGKKFLWTAQQQSNFYRNKKRRNIYIENPFCSKKCVGQYGKHIQKKNNNS